MKLKAIISNPFILLASFSLVFISNQQTGDFYFVYLLAGLFYGSVYAVVGSIGIIVILSSYFLFKGTSNTLEVGFVNLLGAVLLIFSLFLFYYHSNLFNFSGSIFQMAHIISLFTFCILVTCFVNFIPIS